MLVAAHRRDAERHAEAVAALTELASGSRSWAIPWPCVHEFLAVVTHPRIFLTPSTVAEALTQVEAWGASPTLVYVGERDDHVQQLRLVMEEGGIAGPRVHDARVAAICLAHGVTALWTADRDFSRFPRLRTSNPLVG